VAKPALKGIKFGLKAVAPLEGIVAAVAASEVPMAGAPKAAVAASVALKAPKGPRSLAWHSELFGKSRHPQNQRVPGGER